MKALTWAKARGEYRIKGIEIKKKTYKPIPFYFITTNNMYDLTYEKAYESLSELKNRGFGGAVLFNKTPHGFTAEEYLSDDWFTMIENFVKAGKDLELEMWVNDGFDYPPGGAAGRVEEMDPSLCMMRVKRQDGQIVTEEVDWDFPAFEYFRSSELFIEIVYEEYKKRLGQYFGNGIRGFFSDADNRRVNSVVFHEDCPQRNYFPWSKDFRETFSAKYGYDIWEHMDDVLERRDTQSSVDYWQHCSDLYVQWFKGNYEWCQKNGLEYSYQICVKNAVNGVSVKLNDQEYQNMIFRPYTVPCTAKGRLRLELKTYATLANFLEMYPREFGITEGVYLQKIQK